MGDQTDAIGLYIHIPFCHTKCGYCDFNTYAGIDQLAPQLIQSLKNEVEAWGGSLGRVSVKTVFFGGGTPSYLEPTDLDSVWASITSSFEYSADREATLEANPDDIDCGRAVEWLKTGFTRISIGAQSFTPRILREMQRRHSADGIVAAFKSVREAGFSNISLDLIFGWPRQTLTEWRTALERALELEPQHLSLYSLQVEPRTPLERWIKVGRMPSPDDDLAADMYAVAREELQTAGYQHYEISNWCKPTRQSQHNLAYWRGTPYLGVGPGAHSSLGGTRHAVIKSPRAYIKKCADASAALNDGTLFCERETTTRATAMGDTIMLGLRLLEGVSNTKFKALYGCDMQSVWGSELRNLADDGLVDWDGAVLRLTPSSLVLANEAIGRLVPVPAGGG